MLRPELPDRIDETIVFHKLTKEEITQIVELMMKRVREQMTTHETAIELTDEAKELLVEKGTPGHGRAAATARDPALHRGSAGRLRTRPASSAPAPRS